MVWTSGWKLASAVTNAGALGVIGAGSMSPEILEEHLVKMKAAVGAKPYAVNLPLFYSRIEEQIALLEKYQVPIIISSAGNPSLYTKRFKEMGAKVIHVVSSLKFALKAQDAGVDAVVAEGFEAGGHNGRDETTTLVLLQELQGKLDIPYIAAGGIGSGQAIVAAMALGAVAVQVGSLFVATLEASNHPRYKEMLVNLGPGATKLSLKELMPVRLIKNPFFEQVAAKEAAGASKEELAALLGKGRARRGMFEGDLEEGELEIGQITSKIEAIVPASDLVDRLMSEYRDCLQRLKNL